MRKEKRNRKVVVAMSGGVDSSVAAALLKKGGVDELRLSPRFANARAFDVIGVFMKFWAEGKSADFNRCCSSEAEKRARKVARILEIPFYVFNFEKEFKKMVVDYFLREYRAGRTPNPCVVCNKEIKFGLLLEKALSLNADLIATGHYARLQPGTQNYRLLKGKDKEKDQSYFLWRLNQEQLKHILFPVGNYSKTQVRKLAKKFKLPVFEAPESMEVCFVQGTMVAETSSHLPPRPAQRVGRGSVNDFLKKHLKEKAGNIVDKKGKILGRHRGLWFYTIGQRKGIGLADGPYYVLDKDLKRNTLLVTKNEKDLLKKELIAKNVNWLSDRVPKLPLKIKAKIRYRHQAVLATITKKLKAKSYKLIFRKSQRAVTPGQSAVFYQNEELLGGGMIC
jgi:tRNA-specific 2-thiouridylase